MSNAEESLLEQLDKRIALILPLLNERQRRLYLAAEAMTTSKIGISVISSISGVSRNTIASGIQELKDFDDEPNILENVRKSGAGRKKIHEEYPELNRILQDLLCKNGVANEFFSWSGMSIREIREILKEKGYWVGRTTVAGILQEMGYVYYGADGDPNELYCRMKDAFSREIPVIDLEIIGTIRNHMPNRVWEFIRNWWKSNEIMVVSSLTEKKLKSPDIIIYYPYPSGYIRWESRRLCATLIPPDSEGENELCCLLWQLC